MKMKKLCSLTTALLLLCVVVMGLLTSCGGTPVTTTTTMVRVGDTGVDWPNQLFKFYNGLGKGEIDIEAFKATASAQKTVEYQTNFYLFKNEMDPVVLAYWEALGMKKEMHEADDADLKWASYTPLKALESGNTAKYPVVFDFVGGERLIFSAEGHGFANVGAVEGFVTICPANPVSNGSTSTTPGGQVVRILDALEAGGYPIDRTRVYVVGMSAGGIATSAAGLEIPDVIAGVAMHSSLAALNTAADEAAQMPFFTSASEYTRAMVWGLPMMIIVGDHDFAQLPIKSAGILEGLNLWLEVNGVPTQLDPAEALAAAATSTDEAAKNLGFVGGKMWTKTIDGLVHHGAEFDRADGTKMVELICVTNTPHWPSGSFPEIAWDFLSKFSRAADGTLIVAQ